MADMGKSNCMSCLPNSATFLNLQPAVSNKKDNTTGLYVVLQMYNVALCFLSHFKYPHIASSNEIGNCICGPVKCVEIMGKVFFMKIPLAQSHHMSQK